MRTAPRARAPDDIRSAAINSNLPPHEIVQVFRHYTAILTHCVDAEYGAE